jgi:hypothetical protein
MPLAAATCPDQPQRLGNWREKEPRSHLRAIRGACFQIPEMTAVKNTPGKRFL